jgi:hypothetical protein
MESDTHRLDKCSDICAETATIGFQAKQYSTLRTSHSPAILKKNRYGWLFVACRFSNDQLSLFLFL